MLKNIVILDNEPFSVVRKRNFFVEEFLRKGYNVCHYSLTSLLTLPGTTKYTNTEKSEIAFTLDNKKEVKKLLGSIKTDETFIFVELHFNTNTYFLFKYLHAIKAVWGRISYYTNPAVNLYKKPAVVKSEKVKRYKDFDYVKFAIFVKLFDKKINRITESHITFKTGESNFNFPKSRKLVNINYFDLEEFKNSRNNQPLLNFKYIVFNDIFLPFHPDLQRINRGSIFINPKEYFDELNLFFEKVEKHYGLEVVIAAHPKAEYLTEFGTRKVIYGQTANLISNCELLITHLSVSIDYALFSNKPVLFFYTPSLFNSEPLQYMLEYMKIYADKINSWVIDSSSQKKLPAYEQLEIDVSAYDHIIKKYFGDLNNEKENFEVVYNELKTLVNQRN